LGDRQPVLQHEQVVTGLVLRIAAPQFDLELWRQLEPDLAKYGGGLLRVGAFQPVLARDGARWGADQEVTWREGVGVLLPVGAEYPVEAALVRRDQVELLRVDGLADVVTELPV